MPIRVVRLGSPRTPGEGIRIGTVRRPPRGVRKEDFARLDFYDVRLPELAPSEALLAFAHAEELTDKRWAAFTRKYRAEMGRPGARDLIALLAALSRQTSFSVGCYCEDRARCHRSLLAALLEDAGAEVD